MGDIGPCELIDGRIIMDEPTGDEHAGIEVNVTEALNSFVRPRKLATCVSGKTSV